MMDEFSCLVVENGVRYIETDAVVYQLNEPGEEPQMIISGWSHCDHQIGLMRKCALDGVSPLQAEGAIWRIIKVRIPIVETHIEATATVVEGGENERT
jgi:hypothetical protein